MCSSHFRTSPCRLHTNTCVIFIAMCCAVLCCAKPFGSLYFSLFPHSHRHKISCWNTNINTRILTLAHMLWLNVSINSWRCTSVSECLCACQKWANMKICVSCVLLKWCLLCFFCVVVDFFRSSYSIVGYIALALAECVPMCACVSFTHCSCCRWCVKILSSILQNSVVILYERLTCKIYR